MSEGPGGPRLQSWIDVTSHTTFRDSFGNRWRGHPEFHLLERIPPNLPMEEFWTAEPLVADAP